MRTFAERFYSALENQLNEVSINGESLAEQYKTSITLCKKAMAKLKNYISSYFEIIIGLSNIHFHNGLF